MKKFCVKVQVFALTALVASVILGAFIPAMFYVAAVSMVVLALASFFEPVGESARPEVSKAVKQAA